MNLDKLELSSYLLLILGVSTDQLSTRIGLSRYNLYESNVFAARLMDLGLWGYVDLFLCLFIIVMTRNLYKKHLEEKAELLFIFPLISGLIRLVTGLMNFSLF
jgi:hypothetical protein